ncbi:putative zeta tubulin [Leptomonas pyrrhocoris]|uniref:Putative zeta tubulin n=1 Tax=Leptomonas pyrrhocoris TaxID=157538 RepID=A0A0M9FST4_LEPPY|nr:putative zeta tubulin [Leptomonas pyrrhocoris]KPA75360.1 putative zeta tubulin [Leptomonas pyrrhocoris]|eukprot:XP_015653799.1 putative zeta tubulin [Leptomonas pyrrhocoris]
MAIVVVLVGQCGNQFGDELFTQLALCTGITSSSSPTSKAAKTALPSVASPSASSSVVSPFFTRDGMARCVLVDTEPKVVLGVRQRHANFMRQENVIHGQSGRGNNWGLGYHGVKTAGSKRNEDNAAVQRAFRNIARDQREDDDNVLGKALQAIYRETRRTSDADDGTGGFEAIVIMHSLVGGTGSGLASRLTERLRLYFTAPPPGQQIDEVYESTMMRIDGFDGGLYGAQRRARHLVNVAVAPQVVGEVATQGLNAALTLHVLQKHADAVVLLRNDDAMAPGEVRGSSVCDGASVLHRCVTFKEANEVLVALLLPVLRYGVEVGCITQLLTQCIPPGYRRTTGGNKILTLLPTPQRSYAALRQCVHRALFCAIEGGRVFMPGYKPTVPIEDLLSKTAQQLSSSQPRRASNANGNGRTAGFTGGTKAKLKPSPSTRKGPPPSSAQQPRQSTIATTSSSTSRTRITGEDTDSYEVVPYVRQRRLSGQRQRQQLGFRVEDEGGVARAVPSSAKGPFASASASASSARRPLVTPFSSPPAKARSRVQAPVRAVATRLRYGDEEREGERDERDRSSCIEGDEQHDADGDGGEEQEDANRRVFQRCSTKIPPPLYRHYQQLSRAPVTKMFETIDGVLLLNEAVELDRRVLFPLLKSAALKVSSGAFMSSYEDVGVTSERVTRSIREVAEVMADSEAL